MRQSGASAVEFTIAALLLFLAALAVIETANWQQARQLLSLALLEAARAGAVTHAHRGHMAGAFQQGLLPLFSPPGQHADAFARMRAEFAHTQRGSGLLPWRIDILRPGAASFADHADPRLRVQGARGRRVIRNDYQGEQHERRRAQGWPEGRGPRSGETVFDANTLHLRLTYLHTPRTPPWRAVLRALGGMDAGRDGHRRRAWRAGMLPIVLEVEMPMQSHPVQWLDE